MIIFQLILFFVSTVFLFPFDAVETQTNPSSQTMTKNFLLEIQEENRKEWEKRKRKMAQSDRIFKSKAKSNPVIRLLVQHANFFSNYYIKRNRKKNNVASCVEREIYSFYYWAKGIFFLGRESYKKPWQS